MKLPQYPLASKKNRTSSIKPITLKTMWNSLWSAKNLYLIFIKVAIQIKIQLNSKVLDIIGELEDPPNPFTTFLSKSKTNQFQWLLIFDMSMEIFRRPVKLIKILIKQIKVQIPVIYMPKNLYSRVSPKLVPPDKIINILPLRYEM